MICCSLATGSINLVQAPAFTRLVSGIPGYSRATFSCPIVAAATPCVMRIRDGLRDRASPTSARGRAAGGLRITSGRDRMPSRRRRSYPLCEHRSELQNFWVAKGAERAVPTRHRRLQERELRHRRYATRGHASFLPAITISGRWPHRPATQQAARRAERSRRSCRPPSCPRPDDRRGPRASCGPLWS
jgi:hypothetical protein